jgi:hypothetical protein
MAKIAFDPQETGVCFLIAFFFTTHLEIPENMPGG